MRALLLIAAAGCSSAADPPVMPLGHQTPMPTGNGHGFAVYAPDELAVTAFYAHPYRFSRESPLGPMEDGIATPSLLERLSFRGAKPELASYVAESHVIAVGKQRFYMPFGVERAALIASGTGCLDILWRADGHQRVQTIGGRDVAIETFDDASDVAAIVPLDLDAKPAYATCSTGSTAWMIVGAADEAELTAAIDDVIAWQSVRRADRLLSDELSAFEAWRSAPPSTLSRDERSVWRQSETMLRMAQIRETGHARGLVLASLPPGEWFIPWTRDMTYAIVALAKLGHTDEARAALTAMLDARGLGKNLALVRNLPYQISTVRYFGDGSEEADYSGEDDPNVELDSWGLALWAAGEYLTASGDRAWLAEPTYRGTIADNLRDYVIAPLAGNLDPVTGGSIVARDTSIWEQNDLTRKHYAASTISAIVGLRAIAPYVATEDLVPRLEAGFASAFVRDGRVHGTVETSTKNDIDAAAVLAIAHGVVTPEVATATLASFDAALAVPSGGYRRVTGKSSYEAHEFVWVDLMLARPDLLATVTARALRDHGMIPEMYVSRPDAEFPGEIGEPTGAIPMIGYGAGAYLLALLR